MVPADPLLAGVRVVMQSVNVTATGSVDAVSNLWGMHVQ
jgi:hypothetical protein